MDQYLRLLAQRQQGMPASGGTTAAARAPQTPDPSAPSQTQQGPWTQLGKQATGMAMNKGINMAGDYFQKYLQSIGNNPAYTANMPYGNAPMDATGGAGYEGMMGWGVDAGAGAGAGAGAAAGGIDWSMLGATAM
jgi:hypothetical protein